MLICYGVSHGQSATYTVDGTANLATIASQVQGKTSGVLRVRFKTYQNVGQFSITALSADSLIFERAEESAEPVEFSGTLFQIRNVTTPVIFRNLAFKSLSGSGKLIEGLIPGSANKSLMIDSCMLFGDSLNTSFVSWLGGTGSKVQIQRSVISGSNGPSPQIDLTTDTLKISNSYLNFSGQVVATITKRLDFSNVTTNRVQFRLTGDGTTIYSFKNNLYGHPPSANKLPGNTNKFVMYLLGFVGGAAYGDYRFSTWYNFEYPSNDGHADPSNISIPPFGDTTSLWDFRMAGDSTNGYQNPFQAKFPAFNVFPGDTVLPVRLTAKDSAVVSLVSAQIPRVITASYGSVTYPSITDSTRTLWLKDTTLQILGPASIRSIAFPKAQSQGTPLLFYQSGANFLPGTAGVEGRVVFSNSQAAARVFIPAFSGQNTFKGTGISVKNLSSDTSLVFSVITRAGRTTFQAPSLSATNKRWRVLQKAGKPIAFKDTTTAEGSGTVLFGIGKSAADSPFLMDSLSWWAGGTTWIPSTDSAGKYWGKTAFANSLQAELIERLAIGMGDDTVTLAQGKIVSRSTTGHQLKADSSYLPDQSQYPDMGSFSRGLSFTWSGRGVGDSFALTLSKSNKLQKAYAKNGSVAVLLSPTQEDSVSLTLSFGVGDSGKVVFLAALKSELALASDSRTLVSTRLPDILRVGTLKLPWGENALSGHLRLYGMEGALILDTPIARERATLSFAGLGRTTMVGWWSVSLPGMRTRRQSVRVPVVPNYSKEG
jgi:hypothetical protein